MKINKRVLRDRRFGDRRIRFKYMGSVDDVTKECWGRSPALMCLVTYNRPYYQEDWRVYSDEITLPDEKFCLNRVWNEIMKEPVNLWCAMSWCWLSKKYNSKPIDK